MLFLIRIFRRFLRENLREIERNSRIVAEVHRYFTAGSAYIRNLIIHHFLVSTTAALICIGVYVFYHPSLAGKTACYMFIIEYDDLIRSDSERKCQFGSVVALVWDNAPTEEITGSMLMQNSVLLQETQSRQHGWLEVYLPKGGKLKRTTDGSAYRAFVFEMSNSDAELDFHVGSCETGHPQPDVEPIFEVRRGFILRSEPRAGITRKLSPKDQTECNALDAADRRSEYCAWGKLEFFIQSVQPHAFCSPKQPVDYWLGVSRVNLPDRPYLCLRGVDMKGSPVGSWVSFARIRSVWCD